MILSDIDLKRYIDSGRLQVSMITGENIGENGLDLRFGREFAVMKRRDGKPFDTRGANNVRRYFDVLVATVRVL